MKLLDEKGLTTVWAAIKNTFTSKSDADGKYAKKADLNPATSTSAGVMTAADKNKLDNIEEDANNYFLPLAANGTRGGIQLGRASISVSDRFQYPLLVDGNEKAYVSIPYATSGLDGLMTSEDKDKLDGIASDLCKINLMYDISKCKEGSVNIFVNNSSKDFSVDSIKDKYDMVVFAYVTRNCNITANVNTILYNNVPNFTGKVSVTPGMFLIIPNQNSINIFSF